jgi:hypothetical protein
MTKQRAFALCLVECALWCSASTNWYDGIDGIKVISDSTAATQQMIKGIYAVQKDGQFNTNRYALLFTEGKYDLDVPAGYYTSIAGVTEDPSDVTIRNVYSEDGDLGGGATQNFWRSAEGMTVTNPTARWAVSQACPLRRAVFEGDLWLSEVGPPHWSSGGFMADVSNVIFKLDLVISVRATLNPATHTCSRYTFKGRSILALSSSGSFATQS